MRHAHLDCVGGLAGDMLLAALLDAGAPEEALREVPARLSDMDVALQILRVERHGLSALHVTVEASDTRHSRSYQEIRGIVERADFDEPVRQRSLQVLDRLAEAESRVHGVSLEQVTFHELGGPDTLIDICGGATLFAALDVSTVSCSALPVAHGLVEAAHGLLPLPAPATLELLRGARLAGVDGTEETVTPTGAALAATYVTTWGSLPPMTLERIGVGAGTRNPDNRPNVLRIMLGTDDETATEEIALLETNLDDLSPELVPDAAARCFAAGALDVWSVPAQMKKGRPGIVFSALARPADEPAVATAILEETSALGVRVSRIRRYELEREERVVSVVGGSVRVKIGYLDGRVVNVAPEHDDCADIAQQIGRPVKLVWAEAVAATQSP